MRPKMRTFASFDCDKTLVNGWTRLHESEAEQQK